MLSLSRPAQLGLLPKIPRADPQLLLPGLTETVGGRSDLPGTGRPWEASLLGLGRERSAPDGEPLGTESRPNASDAEAQVPGFERIGDHSSTLDICFNLAQSRI